MQIVVAEKKLVFIERRKYFKSIYHFKIHMPVLVFALIILINSLLFVSHWESFSRIAISVLLSRHLQAHTCSIVLWKGTDFLHYCPDKLPKFIILDTCIRYANQSIIFKQLCPCVVDVEQQPISVPHECFWLYIRRLFVYKGMIWIIIHGPYKAIYQFKLCIFEGFSQAHRTVLWSSHI